MSERTERTDEVLDFLTHVAQWGVGRDWAGSLTAEEVRGLRRARLIVHGVGVAADALGIQWAEAAVGIVSRVPLEDLMRMAVFWRRLKADIGQGRISIGPGVPVEVVGEG